MAERVNPLVVQLPADAGQWTDEQIVRLADHFFDHSYTAQADEAASSPGC